MPVEEDMDIEEVERDTERFVEEQIAAGTSTAPRHSIYQEVGRDTDRLMDEQVVVGTSTAPRHSIYQEVEKNTAPTVIPVPTSTTPILSSQPRKSTTPLHPPPTFFPPAPTQSTSAEAGPSSRPVPAPAATSPRTPRTRRTAPPAVTDPLPEIQVDEASQWGRRYELTRDTLNIAIKKSTEKWT